MKITFLGSEPVLFRITDKDSGKKKEVMSPRVAYAEYDDKGNCIDMRVVKATADFADSIEIGKTKECKGVAYDSFGRACTLY